MNIHCLFVLYKKYGIKHYLKKYITLLFPFIIQDDKRIFFIYIALEIEECI